MPSVCTNPSGAICYSNARPAPQGRNPARVREKAYDLLKQVGLAHKVDSKIEQLSGGALTYRLTRRRRQEP